MAFQVIDDILDFESSEDVMRKPVGKDLMEGLCTLPLIYALEADRKGLEALLPIMEERQSNFDELRIAALIDKISSLGALERAREAARRYTTRALAEIRNLPSSAAKGTGIPCSESSGSTLKFSPSQG